MQLKCSIKFNYIDNTLRTVQIGHYISKNTLLNNKIKALNAMSAVGTLYVRCVRTVCTSCARRKRTVSTLQQLHARCKSVIDPVRTQGQFRGDAVWTL